MTANSKRPVYLVLEEQARYFDDDGKEHVAEVIIAIKQARGPADAEACGNPKRRVEKRFMSK
jgi:hypothetical protein